MNLASARLVGRGVEEFMGGLFRLLRQKLLSCELLETEAYVIYYVCSEHRGQSKASVST
jgi:hypothetical protein